MVLHLFNWGNDSSFESNSKDKKEIKKQDMTRTIKILTLLAAMIITAGQAWADEEPVASGYCGKPEVNEGKNLVWEVTKNGGSNSYGDTYDVTISVNPNANEIVGTNFDMADFDNNFDNDDFAFYVSPWSKAVYDEPFVLITKVTIGEGVTSIGNGLYNKAEGALH